MARQGSTVFDLHRFVKAQDPVIEEVLSELRAGRKQTHWMWFVFPQLRNLGRSPMAQYYGITSLAEAKAYLDHPVLGPRLKECTEVALSVSGRTIHDILGSPDDIKFGSSMTLFDLASDHEPIFRQALDRYCGGIQDPATLKLLEMLN